MPESTVCGAEILKKLCEAVLQKAGAVPPHAAIIADTLIEANLRGVDTHGVMRLKIYALRLEKGITNADPQAIKILRESPTTCLIEGGDVASQVLSVIGMEKAIALAQKSGVGVVGVRNSGNFGAAAYYPMMALAHDMVGLGASETRPNLAPFGSAVAGTGNNPMAMAVPAGEFPPLVLDMAMSVAAGGKIRQAAFAGRPIPEGWVVDGEGRPSTDPLDYVDPKRKGCLVPFAGHKGSGLSIMIAMLAGALMGPAFGFAVGPAWSLEEPTHAGHIFAAMRLDCFCDPAEFKQRVDTQIRFIKSCKPAKGVEEIMMPGEPEARKRAERLAEGIPLEPSIVRELQDVAAHFGVELPRELRSGS